MSTKALSVVVATIVALLIVDTAAAVTFDWWNSTWHYQVNVTINTSVYNRTDWPIEQDINFTQRLQDLGRVGAFDNNSVRVIEYNSTGSALSEIESQFDKGEKYDKNQNAYGKVVWLLNGTRQNDTLLYYQIYFDTEGGGAKPPPNYASTLAFYSFTEDSHLNFGLNNSKIAIRVDTDRGINHTSGMYFAEVLGSSTVIFDSPSSQDPIEYLKYYNSVFGNYGHNFTDNFEVLYFGPVRIVVRQNGSEKDWGTADPPTITGNGYMTKTYTMYKNSQYIRINQTFTSIQDGTGRQSDGVEALSLDIDRTNMAPTGGPHYKLDTASEPSWASVARSSMGLGVININESPPDFIAGRDPFNQDLGIAIPSTVTINDGESISELAAVYFNNVTSHTPVEALRNRTKDDVIITTGEATDRKIEVQPQTDYSIYNRNETINVTGNVTLDTHNLSFKANATITDSSGANV
ncbi:MAG: hypothetical protein V3R86_02115, partial [Candidatus Hydrothermarchaeaceae archaeon]